jgi:hypothetical protein
MGENQTNSTASYWLKITGRKISGLAGAEVLLVVAKLVFYEIKSL